MIDFDYQVMHLSADFYNNYPADQYIEILDKDNRAYNCLLIDTNSDYFICVPYRSEIRHNNAYKFSGTNRSCRHRSGLDYSKIIIVKNENYLSDSVALIDNDEYNETVVNIRQIVEESTKYVNDYILHLNGTQVLHNREFCRRYQFSTLKYFHQELGISTNHFQEEQSVDENSESEQ